MAFFISKDLQKYSKIHKPIIYNWNHSYICDPKLCTVTGFTEWNTAKYIDNVLQKCLLETQITKNNQKKEDDNMNKTSKPNGAKNRMGVFSRGISFDTPSGTTQYIIPQIKEIKAINNRVVIIKFKDGTQEKAVLDSSDTFSIEQGVAICITKKILSKLTYGNGSSVYNKLIDYAMKIYKKQENDKAKAEAEKTKTEQQENKREEKRKKRIAKTQERERAEYIDILSEAIAKAMQSMNLDSLEKE